MKEGATMGDMLQYKGYTGTVEYSKEDGCLFGKVIGIRSRILYNGLSVDDLIGDFEAAVDDYLNMCEENGEQPEIPFKGSFTVRIGSELHQKVDQKARENNTSINAIVKKAIAAYCG